MNQLDEREEDILECVIRDFVRTATPVSSARVREKNSMSYSPATIRNIMGELGEAGYLYQPHTSSGRSPTEKGYHYFVDFLMTEQSPSLRTKKYFEEKVARLDGEELFDALSLEVAKHLSLLGGVMTRRRMFRHGLGDVLRNPEFGEVGMAAAFVDFVENIDAHLPDRNGVTIGDFGVVSYRAGPEVVVFSIGPQRMDYEKALSLVHYLGNLI